MFCYAAFFFKDSSYTKVAIKAGEAVWNQGLLRKGNGLCHGISGNAYALHTLARHLEDSGEEDLAKEWNDKAWTFASALQHPLIKEEQG